MNFLSNAVQSVDQKFLIADTRLYDFDETATNMYMVISGSVSLTLGRTRIGGQTIRATLGRGDWFGWEALTFSKYKSEHKPTRRTSAKSEKDTALYVVPTSKFRKLFMEDEEARFDLEDSWLKNMDADVLAWTLHHFPPKLDENEMVASLDDPLEKEEMKTVLLNSMVQKGERDAKTKKGVEAAVKAMRLELSVLKKETAQELHEIKQQNIALKESVQKSLTVIQELLQQKK